MDKAVNERIRYYRAKLKYTQSQVAKMLDVKKSTYSQMERKGSISCGTLMKLSDILKTDVLTLLYGEELERNEIPEPKKAQEDIITKSMILAEDLQEKVVVIAMRNLPSYKKQEIYEFVLNKLKEY